MTSYTEQLSSDQRLSKINKIRALLAKTTANGCTHDEYESARAMADHLMEKYGIAESECQPEPTRRPRYSGFDSAGEADWFSDFFREAQRQQDQERRTQRAREAYAKAERERAARERRARAAREGAKATHSFFDEAYASADNDPFDPYADAARGPERKAGRKNRSHAYCSHENSSAARARCRRENA